MPPKSTETPEPDNLREQYDRAGHLIKRAELVWNAVQAAKGKDLKGYKQQIAIQLNICRSYLSALCIIHEYLSPEDKKRALNGEMKYREVVAEARANRARGVRCDVERALECQKVDTSGERADDETAEAEDARDAEQAEQPEVVSGYFSGLFRKSELAKMPHTAKARILHYILRQLDEGEKEIKICQIKKDFSSMLHSVVDNNIIPVLFECNNLGIPLKENKSGGGVFLLCWLAHLVKRRMMKSLIQAQI